MVDEQKTHEAVPAASPTGQAVGLTALLAKSPPWVMQVLLGVVGLAGAVETVAIIDADLLPAAVVKGAHVVLAFAVALGLASPGARRHVPLVLLVLSIGLMGCPSTKGFLVSGETLDQAGAQFELAAPIVAEECQAQALPLQFCRDWRDFALKFQALYRPSVEAWRAAATLNDAALERRYADMVAPLLSELTSLYAALQKAQLVPGGAP